MRPIDIDVRFKIGRYAPPNTYRNVQDTKQLCRTSYLMPIGKCTTAVVEGKIMMTPTYLLCLLVC